MKLDTLLDRPNAQSVILLELTVGVALEAWVVDGANWKCPVPENVNLVSLAYNGADLTQADSTEDMTPGSWFQAGQWVWVQPPADGNVYADTIIGTAGFYFSDSAKVLNGQYYEDRLQSIPKLSMKIETRFSGVIQTGQSDITLLNGDGFFDGLDELCWDNGRATILYGVDAPGQEMAYSDYQPVAVFNLLNSVRDNDSVRLTLKERKNVLTTKLPFTFYDQTAYPNIKSDLVGKVIPLIWGHVYSVPADLIDPTTGRHKVCSNACVGFTTLKMKQTLKQQGTMQPVWVADDDNQYVWRYGFEGDVVDVLVGTTTTINIGGWVKDTHASYYKASVPKGTKLVVVSENGTPLTIANDKSSMQQGQWYQHGTAVYLWPTDDLTPSNVVGITGTALTNQSNLPDVANTAGTWCTQNGVIYIHLKNDAAPAADGSNVLVVFTTSRDIWVEIPFSQKFLDCGEFIPDMKQWDGNAELAVDVIGLPDAVGQPMENPADVVKSMLLMIGETDLDLDAFQQTWKWFNVGTDQFGNYIHIMKQGIYLSEQTEVLQLVTNINFQCATFLVDRLSKWAFLPCKPVPSSGLKRLTDADIFSISKTINNEKVVTQVNAYYAQRVQEEWTEFLPVNDLRAQLKHGLDIPLALAIGKASKSTQQDPRDTLETIQDLYLYDAADVALFIARELSMEGTQTVTEKFTVHKAGVLLLPGDHVVIDRARDGKRVVEIIEVNFDLDSKALEFTVSNNRGWGDSVGFWVDDKAPAWDPTSDDSTKAERKMAAGYWTDENGFANSGDAKSFKVSRWWV